MILTCPECKARYVVNPNVLLPQGRTVRCAKCAHSWFEKNSDNNADISQLKKISQTNETKIKENEAPGNDGGSDTQTNKKIKRLRPAQKKANLPALQNQKYESNKIGWVSLAIFITILSSSFIIFQDPIVSNWASAQKLYIALGLDNSRTIQPTRTKKVALNESPLRIEVKKVILKEINKISHLVIEGTVENHTDYHQIIPTIKVTLIDESRRNIFDWNFKPETTSIQKGESIDFINYLPSPPKEARDVSITFTIK
jgi:predicted Zn finger-like uncharacterized protein